MTGVTVVGVRGHFVAVEAHVGRGRRDAMSLSLQSVTVAADPSTNHKRVRGTKMSDTNQDETFTERVDVTTQPDGALVGRLEIDVRPGDHRQSPVEALAEENRFLVDRVAELERENADLRT